MAASPDYASVAATLHDQGLAARGGFHPSEEDGVPLLPSGTRPATLVLAGNVGHGMWQTFSAYRPVESADNEAHPTLLDDWSRTTLHHVADALGDPAVCVPLFPFGGPPFLPFIRWAQKAEAVFPSPIGPLIHPDYGLWHAYRGALAFADHLDVPRRDDRESPCETCREKPCLTGCPVGAHGEGPFDLAACITHIDSAEGAACMSGGCLARRACPIGDHFRYAPAHAHFHMVAFRRTNRGAGG